jgi:hypothetical protein
MTRKTSQVEFLQQVATAKKNLQASLGRQSSLTSMSQSKDPKGAQPGNKINSVLQINQIDSKQVKI